ncbi:uncharacterized protein LOC124309075 [Neodiprion virginianus]|uniref:uncharacterized protein LOC124309075 n=1 Tax=Neodiprion virginianus TaxID=2961670 RepID=UPI001EE718A7|nr:uncharacterized protein LOC124309075 [Neodiprion virginianus]
MSMKTAMKTNNTKRKRRTICFVPGCLSNSDNSPNKVFIAAPRNSAIRKKWAESVGLTRGLTGDRAVFNPGSWMHCCEDHFNLPEDAEHWDNYTVMGGPIRVKHGVVPHLNIQSREDETLVKSEPQDTFSSLRLSPKPSTPLEDHLVKSSTSGESFSCSANLLTVDDETDDYKLLVSDSISYYTSCDNSTQCNLLKTPHYVSKGCNTDSTLTINSSLGIKTTDIPYNLRSKQIAQVLMDDDAHEEALDEASSDEEDYLSQESSYSTESEDDFHEDENTSLEQRPSEVCAQRDGSVSENSENSTGDWPLTTLQGKNGYKWSTKILTRCSDRHLPSESKFVPGPVGPAAGLSTIEDFWSVLFTDEIFKIIVDNTNDKIENVCTGMISQGQTMQSYHHHTDMEEMKAYVALFYYSGAWKCSNVDIHELWSASNGLTFYRCVMPRMRFTFLSMCIRFDKKETRDEADKFAPIREVWNIFIRNCQICYNIHYKTTVGEQLLSFRGRCLFRRHMKAKPDKCGLQLKILNDATTAYLYHAIPYLGKVTLDEKLANESIPEYYLRAVTEPIHGSGRTITCDNWFTTIPMLDRFCDEPYNLTVTGTIHQHKREIPADFRVASQTVPHTKFCFSPKITLLSHTPEKNKIILLASTYSKSTEIIDGKPQIILHYNKTKEQTDCFEQLCHAYTVTKRTNRWPVRIFYGILDQAMVNSRILLKCLLVNTGSSEKVRAIDCMRRLALHLATPHLRARLENLSVRRNIRSGIAGILNIQKLSVGEERPYFSIRVRCGLCQRGSDRKSREKCPSCLRSMCNRHRAYICVECAPIEQK